MMNSKNSFLLAFLLHLVFIFALLLYRIPTKIDDEQSLQAEIWEESAIMDRPIIPKQIKISKVKETAVKLEKPIEKTLEIKPNIDIQKFKEKEQGKFDIALKKQKLIQEQKDKKNLQLELDKERKKQLKQADEKKILTENLLKEKQVKKFIQAKQETEKSKVIINKQKEIIKTKPSPQNNQDDLKKLLQEQAKNDNNRLEKEKLNKDRQANLSRLTQSSNENTVIKKQENNSSQGSSGLSANYKAKIQSIIKRHISYSGENNVLSIVKIRLDGNGNLISKTLIKSSGNQDWDSSVIQAIGSSAFPPPEDGKTIDITLRLSPI